MSLGATRRGLASPQLLSKAPGTCGPQLSQEGTWAVIGAFGLRSPGWIWGSPGL